MLQTTKRPIKRLSTWLIAMLLIHLFQPLPVMTASALADEPETHADTVVFSFGGGGNGQLGLGGTGNEPVPKKIEDLPGIQAIAAGRLHSLVLTESGEVYSIGRGSSGQLGHGDTGNELTPRKIEDLPDIQAIAAGDSHSLVLTVTGEVYSFGHGLFGQLGHGDTSNRSVPTKIKDLSGIQAIAAGGYHSLVLTESGEVYSFGYGGEGRLGHGGDTANQRSPKKIESLSGIQAIAAGDSHSLVLTVTGEVYSFGRGLSGQLGHGDTSHRSDPMKIKDLSGIQTIAAGTLHSLVLTESGEVYSFGHGSYGRLGHGDMDEQLRPKKIEDLPDIQAIAAGWSHSLVLTESGEVYSFGSGGSGQLGHGNTSNQSEPTKIIDLSGIQAIAAGGEHSLVLSRTSPPPEQVVMPIADPSGSAVPSGTKVTVSTLTEGATIYYTIDGSEPTGSSAEYTAPIEVTSAMTIKAIAVKDGMLDSEVMEEHYTFATIPAPANLTALAGDQSVHLKWDGVTGTGSVTYSVYQAEDPLAPVDPANWQLAQSNVTADSYLVTGLSNGKTYAFTVKAISTEGVSDFSNAATATPRATSLVSALSLSPGILLRNDVGDLGPADIHFIVNEPIADLFSLGIYDDRTGDWIGNIHEQTFGIGAGNYIIRDWDGTVTADGQDGILDAGFYRIAPSVGDVVLEDESISFHVLEGRGGSDDPYMLSTAEQLYFVSAHQEQLLDKHFELGADIDFTGWNWKNNPWEPIGRASSSFTGSFAGNGHVIKGLVIEKPDGDRGGLFGVIRSPAEIKHIGLLDVQVKGDMYVGALVGVNDDGTVKSSYATGSIAGNLYVGGLVGMNYGTVESSYAATGSVAGNHYVGGLVGSNHGTVKSSHATGSAVGNYHYVGGLVGVNQGTVENSYATGSVKGDFNVGGLAGWNSDRGTVESSYATGSVAGNIDVGGFVGVNEGAVQSSYWNHTVNPALRGIGDGSGNTTGLSTKEMKQASKFDDFDFDDTWTILEGVDFPYLRHPAQLTMTEPAEPVLFAPDGYITLQGSLSNTENEEESFSLHFVLSNEEKERVAEGVVSDRIRTGNFATDADLSAFLLNENDVLATGEYTLWIWASSAARGTSPLELTVQVAPPSADSSLSMIYIDGQEVAGFQRNVTSYSLEASYSTSQVTVTAAVYDQGASYTVRGEMTHGEVQDLKPGLNTIEIKVTAENGQHTSTYTLNIQRLPAGQEAAQPVADPSGGSVPSGTKVILSTSTDGATIHYTTDGSEPTSSSAEYTAPIEVTAEMTIKAVAVKDGMLDSEVMEEHYTVLMPAQVAQPVADPIGGSVPSGATVTLGTSTDGATIYYTTDGSEPTRSSAGYTAPIEVTVEMTIKAVAVKDGMLDSEVMEEHYTIAMIPAPTNLTASAADRSVTLKWDGVTGTGSVTYAVYQAEGSSTPIDPLDWKLTQADITASSYIVTGLTNGKTYAFVVKAVSAEGASDYSNVVIAVPKATEGNGGTDGGYVGRTLSNNADLADLQIWARGELLKLSPAFDSSTIEYTARTEVEQVELVVKGAHSAAKVIWDGKLTTDRIKIDLEEGKNTFVLTIQAENGTKKNYTLTIYRETPTPSKPMFEFTDIAGHWAENDIKRAVEKGMVGGYPDGTFKPNNSVTRAEFTVMLVDILKLDGIGAALPFKDQGKIGAWAERAVALAVQAGIVNGYDDGSFRPDAQITRAEMAMMVAKALGLTIDENATTAFADDKDIPIWAKGAVQAIRELEIVSGRGGNHFVPNDKATRAEAVVMLLRMLGVSN